MWRERTMHTLKQYQLCAQQFNPCHQVTRAAVTGLPMACTSPADRRSIPARVACSDFSRVSVVCVSAIQPASAPALSAAATALVYEAV